MDDYEVVQDLAKAKEWLTANPNQINDFDAKYGLGASEAIISDTYEEYVPPPEPKDGWGMDMLKGAFEGIVQTGVETAQFIGSVASSQGAHEYMSAEQMAELGLGTAEQIQDVQTEQAAAEVEVQQNNQIMQDKLDTVTVFGKDRDTTVGSVTQGISQFVTGMLSVSKLAKIKAFSTIGGGVVAGAITDGVAFDPDEANLVVMLEEQFGISNQIATDLLANDEDNEWENRAKNALTGTAIGLPIDAIAVTLKTIKYMRTRRKVKDEIRTNGEASEATLKEAETLEAEIKTIKDLDGKPKGKFSIDQPRFTTDDGMVFNTQTGARMVDEEVASTAAPKALEAGEVGAAPKVVDEVAQPPKIDTEAPEAPTANSLEGPLSPAAEYRKIQEVQALPAAPNAPKAPEAGTAPKVGDSAQPPKIDTEPPAAPKPPKPKKAMRFITTKRLKDAAISARAMQPAQMTPIGQLNHLGDNIGGLNLDKMDGPVDAIKIIDQMTDVLSESGVLKDMGIDKPQTLKQVEEAALKDVAEETGTPVNVLSDQLAAMELGARKTAEKIVAGKMVLQSTGRRVSELSDAVAKLDAAGDVDTAVERKLVDALTLHADVQASVQGIQTASARAVSAGRIRTADALSDATLDRLQHYGGSKKVRKLAKQLQLAGNNKKARAKIIRKANDSRFLGVLNELWINAILSGPKTHLMNMGSNAINMLVRPAMRTAGGIMTGNPQQIEEGLRQYMYMTAELGESLKFIMALGMSKDDSALRNAMRSLWREEGVLDTASKFDFNQTGSGRNISAQNLRRNSATTGGIRDGAINLSGKIVRSSSRFLMAEDEFFKQIVFRSRLRAKVASTARRMTDTDLDAAGYVSKQEFVEKELDKAILNKEALAEKFDELVQTGRISDDADTKEAFIKKSLGMYNHNSKMAVTALEEARVSTFTNPLEQGTFGKSVQNLINQHPILRQVMPFIQTPINVLNQGFEKTPILGLFVNNNRMKWKNGTPDEKAMIAGAQAIGAITTLSALTYAMNGKITGGGPSYVSDRNKAKLWNSSPDWQPYSVNVGTDEKPNWIELKKLDPHGTLFGVIGDVYEMIEYGRDKPNFEATELVGMIVASFANNVMDKSYMGSLSDFVGMLDGSSTGAQVGNFLENRLASMVPLSSLQYQLNQQNAEAMAELRTLTDKVKARVYGQYDELEPKHDWLTGESVNTPEYSLGFIRQKKVDSGEHQAAAVYSELRKLNHGFVGPMKKIGDIELRPEVFQRLNELVGTIKLSGGRTLLQAIEHKMNSNRYVRATEQAEFETVRSEDDPRVKQISSVINLYKDIAKKKLMQEYPELQEQKQQNDRIIKQRKSGKDPAELDELTFEF